MFLKQLIHCLSFTDSAVKFLHRIAEELDLPIMCVKVNYTVHPEFVHLCLLPHTETLTL